MIEKKKDDKLVEEYHDENINDRIMLPLLQLTYRYFTVDRRFPLVSIVAPSPSYNTGPWPP